MSLDITLSDNCCESCGRSDEVYSTNITHNLGTMARETVLYGVLWRPEQNGIVFAKDLIKPLIDGIRAMENDPARFEKYDATNGWGTYEQFLPWLRVLLAACEDNPNAKVEASR
tara:strand:- start:786 stop:1127 length:342 start_codon:yes stop_codon:yes gene_type:complete